MFHYYGRKKKIANLYPDPLFELIIEPFCGSGAYSLHDERWKKDVELYDTNPIVISTWKYLLQAKEKDIENLPVPEKGIDIRDIKYLTQEERYLMGFSINPGSVNPCNIVTDFSRWKANKKYIAENLYKIKHWKVELLDYRAIQNKKCTWFIDPPYMKQGIHYLKEGTLYKKQNNNHKIKIDYDELAVWILNRKGQLIACEGVDANYLEFVPLIEFKAVGKRISKEFVYIGYNE